MKKILLKGFSILTLGIAFTSCKNDAKTTETSEAKTVEVVETALEYNTISDNSVIIWKANKIVGGHEGTISITKASVSTRGNKIAKGSFIIDINTLECTDIPKEEEGNAKLVSHLLNEDFFDVEKFPSAKFEITNIKDNKLSGNLTLKGITKNITFDTKIETSDDSIIISSDTFTIDRTEWNINHNSGKIMDAAALGDYLIKDDVELKINVKVKK